MQAPVTKNEQNEQNAATNKTQFYLLQETNKRELIDRGAICDERGHARTESVERGAHRSAVADRRLAVVDGGKQRGRLGHGVGEHVLGSELRQQRGAPQRRAWSETDELGHARVLGLLRFKRAAASSVVIVRVAAAAAAAAADCRRRSETVIGVGVVVERHGERGNDQFSRCFE